MNKKAKTSAITIVVIGVIALIVFGVIDLGDLLGGREEEGDRTCPIDGFVRIGDTCACLNVEDTSVTIKAQDKFNPGTTINESVRYKINGGSLTRVDQGTTFTASPGDKIEYLVASEENVSTWYGTKGSLTVPCRGTEDVVGIVYQRPGTFTTRVFNEEGNVISELGTGTAENETLGVGDVVSLVIDFETQYERALPHGAIATIRYASAYYDEVKLIMNGATKTTVFPEAYDSVSTNYTAVAYELPAMISSGKLAGSIVIDVDDTLDPSGAFYNITIEIWDKDYYVDDLNNFQGPAIEDDNSVQIGIQGPVSEATNDGDQFRYNLMVD